MCALVCSAGGAVRSPAICAAQHARRACVLSKLYSQVVQSMLVFMSSHVIAQQMKVSGLCTNVAVPSSPPLPPHLPPPRLSPGRPLYASTPSTPKHLFNQASALSPHAAEDVYDAVLRAGSRLNLPIQCIAERIAGHKWDLPQAPPKASSWVNDLCVHLQMFRERLGQVKGLSDVNLSQVVPPDINPDSHVHLQVFREYLNPVKAPSHVSICPR